MNKQEAGRLGGLTTAARHGRVHMATIGAKGFEAFCKAHCNGDRAMARKLLGLDGQQRKWEATPWTWELWLQDRQSNLRKEA